MDDSISFCIFASRNASSSVMTKQNNKIRNMEKKEKATINPDEESQKQPKILERWRIQKRLDIEEE